MKIHAYSSDQDVPYYEPGFHVMSHTATPESVKQMLHAWTWNSALAFALAALPNDQLFLISPDSESRFVTQAQRDDLLFRSKLDQYNVIENISSRDSRYRFLSVPKYRVPVDAEYMMESLPLHMAAYLAAALTVGKLREKLNAIFSDTLYSNDQRDTRAHATCMDTLTSMMQAESNTRLGLGIELTTQLDELLIGTKGTDLQFAICLSRPREVHLLNGKSRNVVDENYLINDLGLK